MRCYFMLFAQLSLVALLSCGPGCQPTPSSSRGRSSTPRRLDTNAARIVAIGDLHGDLAATHKALDLAGAIDEKQRWIGGDLVIVQTGDLLDRGDKDREVLELFDRLVTDASKSGGRVVSLLGNQRCKEQ